MSARQAVVPPGLPPSSLPTNPTHNGPTQEAEGDPMPLSVNVGLSRKASKDFQSSGVSINVTAELDQSLLARPDELQQQIDALYAQAQQALDRQANQRTDGLDQPQDPYNQQPEPPIRRPSRADAFRPSNVGIDGGMGHGRDNGNGPHPRNDRGQPRPMTESQR